MRVVDAARGMQFEVSPPHENGIFRTFGADWPARTTQSIVPCIVLISACNGSLQFGASARRFARTAHSRPTLLVSPPSGAHSVNLVSGLIQIDQQWISPKPWSEQEPGRWLKQASQTEAFARMSCPQFPGGWSVWK